MVQFGNCGGGGEDRLIYRAPAALRSARSLMTWGGIGGGVGKWSPLGWKPFSSAIQLTVMTCPSGEV